MTDLPTSLGLTMPAPKPLRIHAAQGLHPVAEGTGFAALFASALPRPTAPLAAGDTTDIDEAEIEGLDAVSHESEAVAEANSMQRANGSSLSRAVVKAPRKTLPAPVASTTSTG